MSKLRIVGALALLFSLGLGCSSAPEPVAGPPPAELVAKLMRFYKEDRPRFVRHMEKMEQGDSCGNITAAKTEAERMEFAGEVAKEDDRTLKVVMMEIQQAERKCLE